MVVEGRFPAPYTVRSENHMRTSSGIDVLDRPDRTPVRLTFINLPKYLW